MIQKDENDMKLLVEKEYIILRSIARYGYAAMPQDYDFLNRNSMLNIYLEIVKSSAAGLSISTWEAAVKKHAAYLSASRSLCGILKDYKSSHSKKETMALLDNNYYYWKTLLIELKKSNESSINPVK